MTEAVLRSERPSFTRIRESDAALAHTVVLVGNPNVGKTTLFNALTGENAKVGNYPGITVERRVARLDLPGSIGHVDLVDVPGAYSLSARSPEEEVALDAVIGLKQNPKPSLAIVVIDAGQLVRNAYLALQLVEFQIPTLLALTMMDEVTERPPRPEAVGALFGVPCVAVSGKTGAGLAELRTAIGNAVQAPRTGDAPIKYPGSLRAELDRVASQLPSAWRRNVEHDRAMALWALMSLDPEDELSAPADLRETCEAVRAEAKAAGRDVDLEVVAARYAFLDAGLANVHTAAAETPPAPDWTERCDRVLLHPVWGFSIFLLVMLVVFQSLFSWTDPVIGWIEDGIGFLREGLAGVLPSGFLSDLIDQGVLGGVGNVVVFLPQILLLFFFIGLLEDSGYMARVAYLVDRLLEGVGLHGRAFVPMLSGMACAVPAILATRTMERQRDRLLTMLVVPLMTCSARLPVYSLLIGALFPPSDVFGLVPLQGLLMVGMYVFAVVTTLLAAYVLGRTVVRGRRVPLLLELPRYRWPSLSSTFGMMWQRTREFLLEAGTVILGFTLVLWLLLSFPKLEPGNAEETARTEMQQLDAESAAPDGDVPVRAEETATQETAIEHSYGGRLGKALEPVLAPLGFDWKISVGIVGAFSAREVFVSTMGLVFGLSDAEETPEPLRDEMRAETRPDGRPAYPPLVGMSLMVFFALACQCMSTLAVVKRETRSWRWPLFLFGYMTLLAYVASFIVYQGGKLLGFAG